MIHIWDMVMYSIVTATRRRFLLKIAKHLRPSGICLVIMLSISLLLNLFLFSRIQHHKAIIKDNLLDPVSEISSECISLRGYCSRIDMEIGDFENIQDTIWNKTDRIFMAFNSLNNQIARVRQESLASQYDSMVYNEMSIIMNVCRDIWHRYERLNSEEQQTFVVFYRNVIDIIYAGFGEYPEDSQSIKSLKDAMSYVHGQLLVLFERMKSEDLYSYFLESINSLSNPGE